VDALAFWHDIKFSLRHLRDFSRRPSSQITTRIISGRAYRDVHALRRRAFPPGEVEAARDWLTWPEGAADA